MIARRMLSVRALSARALSVRALSARALSGLALALVLGCGAADADERGSSMPLAPTSPGELARVVIDALPRSDDGLTRELVLEDPDGRALDALHAALARAARGEHTARLAFYGGSHTASDLYTGAVRRRLQEAFGDAGHGFVLPVPPIDRYWQSRVRIADAEGWTVLQPSSKRTGIEHYGLAGMAFEATEAAWAEVETEHGGAASRVEIMYLRQPGGGALEVEIDGAPSRVLDTASETVAPALERIEVPLASHRVTLRTRGTAPVRVFGVVLERDRPGVIVDQLAIAGAKARHQLLWDETTWSTLWAPRAPDLVVLSYGNNELDDRHLAFEEHERHFVEVLARLRRHTPGASCLVIGPSDRQSRGADGEWRHPDALPDFVAMQRRAALAQGCAFVDVLAWQGGAGAVERWLASDPPLEREDRMHFTEHAYRRLGADLVRVLLAGMAR